MQRVRNVTRANASVKAAVAGVEQPSTAVMAESELQRLHDIIDNRTVENAKAQRTRREELKEISAKRVANWPNTIEAQRLKKERARKERFEEEEARRRIIDEQETELQQAKQEAAIRKANTLLYEQNDRIKTFSSKLFLASVLDEREKQMQLKVERKAAAKQSEAEWDVLETEQLRKAEAAELAKLKAADERAYALKKAQLEQLAEIRERKIGARDENIREGLAIKSRAQQQIEEEAAAELKRVADQKARSRELVLANEEQRAIKARKAAEEKAEEEKIFKFAKVKEEQMAERKRRVDEKFGAKLVRRQNLIDRQAELLQEIQAATEEREMRAMRDFEKERREREEREAAARARREADIDAHRKMQLARKDRTRQREAHEKAHMQEVWRHHAERMIDEELDERQEKRRDAERNQHFLLLQAQEKRRQAAHEKRQEYIEGLQLQEAEKGEQEAYENYVNSIMHDYVTRGRGSDLVQTAARRTKTLKSA